MDGIDPTRLSTVHALGQATSAKVDDGTAVRSFEAYMIGEMLRRAMPSGEGDAVFDGGQAGRMYRDHLYQEYARLIAESGDFGLASQLEAHLDPSAAADGREEEAREGSAAEAARPARTGPGGPS